MVTPTIATPIAWATVATPAGNGVGADSRKFLVANFCAAMVGALSPSLPVWRASEEAH